MQGNSSVSQVLALTHFSWYWSEVYNYIASMQVLLFVRIPILYSDNKTTDPPAIWKVSWRTHGLSPESTPIPQLKLLMKNTSLESKRHSLDWNSSWRIQVSEVPPPVPQPPPPPPHTQKWNFSWRTLTLDLSPESIPFPPELKLLMENFSTLTTCHYEGILNPSSRVSRFPFFSK